MKSHSSIFSPTIKAVILTMSISWFAWGLTDIFWSLYINEIVGKNYFFTGVFSGIYQFFTVLSILICGNIVEGIGPLRMLFWSRLIYFFVGPLYFLAGILHSPWLLLLGFLVNAMGKGPRDVSEQAFLMKQSTSRNCSRMLGTSAAVKSIFWITGIFTGAMILYFFGTLFAEISVVSSMYLMIFPAAVIGFLLIYKQKEYFKKHPVSIVKKLKETVVRDKIILPLIRDFKKFSLPLRFSIFLVGFLSFLNEVVVFFIPLRALELGLNYFQIAALVACVYLPLLFMFYSCRMADVHDRLKLFQGGFLLFLFPIIGLSLTSNYIIMGICSVLVILFFSLVSPALTGMVTTITPRKKKGIVASLEFFSMRMTSLTGFFIFGFIAENWSIQTAFSCVAVCIVILSMGTFLLPSYVQKEKLFHRRLLHMKHKLHHHHMVFAHTHLHYSHRRH